MEAVLRMQLLAAPDARLEQVCVLDHSLPGYRPRHLHIQCFFSDGSAGMWLNIDGNLSVLREVLRVVQPWSPVRLHVRGRRGWNRHALPRPRPRPPHARPCLRAADARGE